MKNKQRKQVFVSRKLFPSQIDELAICCFIINKSKLDDFENFIIFNGGRVISSMLCSGVSRGDKLNPLVGNTFDKYFVMAMCQKEVTDIFMLSICKEFKLNQKGNGKAFVLDVLGYMGAKGPFVE